MRTIAILLLFISTVTSISAQSAIDETAKRALIVGRSLQQEQVYLQFDNTAYYLGETMWFKAHVTYGRNNLASELSKVLYVELVAPEGYVVESKKYKLDENGCCNGDFDLMPSLLSGYYEVRAYTRYMLNWGDDAIFSRVFPVFDKVNANNWDFKNMLDRQRINSKETNEPRLTFYPEGGHLVENIENCVVYEYFASDGTFGKDTITIYENDSPIIKSLPTHYGKGKFLFTPKSGKKYHATVITKNNKGKSKRNEFKLPDISSHGVVIRLTEENNDIRIDVGNQCSNNKELGFAILHKGAMGYYKKFDTTTKNTPFVINKSSLPEGVCRVVVFADDIPLAERQFFVYHDTPQKGNRETAKLTVKANNYAPHNLSPTSNQKITVTIEREDGAPIEQDAEFSIAVTDAAGKLSTSWDYNMYTYLLLGSELKGYIPNASQYFDKNNKHRQEQLDLVMLTHGWTSYDWEQLTENTFTDMQPIEKGITLKGTFYRLSAENKIGTKGTLNKHPEPYNPIRFDIQSNNDDIQMSVFRTDSLGRFIIETDDFYGTRIASLSPEAHIKYNKDIQYTFVLDRYFSPQAKNIHYWERNIGTPWQEETKSGNGITKTNPLEYLLDNVEVVSTERKWSYYRPPLSELRLDYLEEWEYAKDVTYMPGKGNQNLDADSTEQAIWEEIMLDSIAQKEMELGSNDEMLYFNDIMSKMDKISLGERMPEYNNVITANNVLRSIFRRYKLPWCYWVHSIVITDEYASDAPVHENKEYLHGKEPEQMTNFKEIIIRSDKKTLQQFQNTEGFWRGKNSAYKNKFPLEVFYDGFLTPTSIFPRREETADETIQASDNILFEMRKSVQTGKISSQAKHPNHVACFVPHRQDSEKAGIVPLFTNAHSATRYTSMKGYSQSKSFYSPDYSNMQPEANNDYRRTLLWMPTVKAKEGKITVELYNSSHCEKLGIEVNGHHGNTYFSNDDITTTRTIDSASQQNTKESNTQNKAHTANTDSVALAQYAEEYAIGVAYYKMKKYTQAVKIFAELNQYNYAPAIRSIGICYREGHGLQKNTELSTKFLLQAARLGDIESMYDIALAYQEGVGTQQDNSKAIQWLKESAKQNDARAQALLGHYYTIGHLVEKDSVRGIELLQSAAHKNNADGLYYYGMCMLANETETDSADTPAHITYIQKAADMQHIDAMLYLMKYHKQHFNYQELYNWAKKLHQLGNKEGTRHLAECYMYGMGVKRDKTLANDLLREYNN